MTPRPRAEIVVSYKDADRLIMVYCASDKTREWVAENVPQFCISFLKANKSFVCDISPVYNLPEVVDYIISQGKDAPDA